MTGPTIKLIAAVARNGGIGKDNQLLLKLPEDLAHFKRTTMGSAILMGRKTWDSIGRPLPGRETIVVTRDRKFTAQGAHVARTMVATQDKDIAAFIAAMGFAPAPLTALEKRL